MTVSDPTVRNFELHFDSLLPAEIRGIGEARCHEVDEGWVGQG